MLPAMAIAAVNSVPSELAAYLKRPEPAYAWSVASSSQDAAELKLTSQTWQGITWTHDLLVVQPKEAAASDRAILVVTGNKGRQDRPMAQFLADQSGLPVAVLFNTPNQPIFGKVEDALIAETFGRYLATKDASWPLLFPMTKGAIKAMDALQEWSKGGLRRFVVTGASKRGWTAWLVGAAGDRRVSAIAPMVIDVLNMPRQLDHQRAMFGGKLSEQIADYSETGLTELLGSAEGRQLAQMVDPYSYLPAIRMPVLVVVGGNDRYWTVDAHTLYWPAIRGRKLLRIVPNAGHNLGDGQEALKSLALFSRASLGLLKGGLPRVDWTPGRLKANPDPARDRRMVRRQNWLAASKSSDFRDSTWMDGAKAEVPADAHVAQFEEYVFQADGITGSFTSGVVVEKPRR